MRTWRGWLAGVLVGVCAVCLSAEASAQTGCFGPSLPETQAEACEEERDCPEFYACEQGRCVSSEESRAARDKKLAEQEALLRAKQGEGAPTPSPDAPAQPARRSSGLPLSPEQARRAQEEAERAAMSADEECDADRRCRIERLKRKQAADRRYKGLEHDRRIAALQESWEEERLAAINRLSDPLSADLVMLFSLAEGEPFQPIGLTVGYTLDATWRFSGTLSSLSTYAYYSETIDGQLSTLDGDVDLWVFGGDVTYLFSDGATSPYASAGLRIMTGDVGSYSYDEFGGGGYSQAELTYHLVGGELGVEVQLALGLRMKLGLDVRYPIYVGASSNGANNEPVREGARGWYKDSAMLNMAIGLGWAF